MPDEPIGGTMLGDVAIGDLIQPIAGAFADLFEDFWDACARRYAAIRLAVVVDGTRFEQVRGALTFLDQNAAAAALLPDLLRARPGSSELRAAIGSVLPAALAAVSADRFELERLIAQALSRADIKDLRDSLARIDALSTAVTAYKAMHDALHLLQPHLVLMRGAAAEQGRWRELKVYRDIFLLQLAAIDVAGKRLADAGFARSLDFRDAIGSALDAIAAAVLGGKGDEIEDAVSDLAFCVSEGMDDVDVLMRNTAQDANAPFQRALSFLAPLAASAAGTTVAPLIVAYVAAAGRTAMELSAAVTEHSRWQRLDRQFEQLQRAVDDAAAGPGPIIALWRMTSRALNELCGGPPPPPWASPIATLMGQTAVDLTPPLTPPLPDAARDRVKDLIDNGRARFMAVDQSLLDWLEQSINKRPALVSLLRGEAADG